MSRFVFMEYHFQYQAMGHFYFLSSQFQLPFTFSYDTFLPNKLFSEFSPNKFLVRVDVQSKRKVGSTLFFHHATVLYTPFSFQRVNCSLPKVISYGTYVLIGLKIVIYLYFIHYIFHFCYLKRRHNGTHESDVCCHSFVAHNQR